MQFNILICVCACAAIAFAQQRTRDWAGYLEEVEFSSVISVLETTLPSSLLPEPGYAYDVYDILDAAVSDIAASTAMYGSGDLNWYPEWVGDLPYDVQTWLELGPLTYAGETAAAAATDATDAEGGYGTDWYGQGLSVASILKTAVPSSVAQDVEAFASAINSDLDPDASTYPSWVSALPSDVLTYFEIELETVPGATLIVPPPPTASLAMPVTTVTSTTLASITKPPRTTATATQTTGGTTMTTTASGGGGGVGDDVPGGAAAMPMVGTGAVILAGVAGLLAL